MAEQNRPSSPASAPNPAHSYERGEPAREAGLGQLDNMAAGATPVEHPDKMERAAGHGAQVTRQPDDDIQDGNGSRSRNPSRSEARHEPAEGDVRPQHPPGKDFKATGPR